MKRSFYALLCAMLMCCAFLFVSCGEEEAPAGGETACQHEWADATCTTPKTCSKCGEKDGAALGHTTVAIPAVDATCSATGLTAGEKCSVCGTITKAQTTVAKLEHTAGEWETVKGATCVENGEKAKFCTVCSEKVETEVIPATGEHVDANTDSLCDNCGQYVNFECEHEWADANCLAPKTCTKCGQTEGLKGGHTWGDWVETTPATCLTAGEKTRTCTVCQEATETEPIAKLGHTDAEEDGVCDVCGQPTECKHTFNNTDYQFDNNTHWVLCDICGDEKSEAEKHEWDGDGLVCEICGYDYIENGHECEFDTEWSYDVNSHWHATLCGHEDTDAFGAHSDEDGDKICDVCKMNMIDEYNPEDKYATYNWATKEIIVCLNENSNNKELTSNLRRYLAGDTDTDEYIDDLVKERNEMALQIAKVTVSYTYWGAGGITTDKSGWGQSVEKIANLVLSNAPGSPDIYCNQIYDMVAASLRGSFANIRTTKLAGGDNNFSFTEPGFEEYRAATGEEWGYMMEYMTELGFSVKKQYLVASDYFIDLVRAFFVVPMNLNLLSYIDIDSSTGDRDDDGDFDVDDFYAMVMNGEWTYRTLMQYCEAIYSGSSGVQGGSMQDRNGFILTNTNGLFSSAILYTTSIKIFERELRPDGFYNCIYPETNEELFTFCDKLAEMVQADGVHVEGVTHLAIREQFVANNVLFGGIALLGSLEDQEYQDMKTADGFGILPVPVYRDGDSYLTLIHNMGRIAGIATNTTEFAECSAYIDYQSTHSSDILDEYYEYKLQYDMAGGTKGNIAILQYIRQNVRSAFDKTYDDAIGFYFKGADANASKESWAGIISDNAYVVTTMRSLYVTNTQKRVQYLNDIIKAYDKLPE